MKLGVRLILVFAFACFLFIAAGGVLFAQADSSAEAVSIVQAPEVIASEEGVVPAVEVKEEPAVIEQPTIEVKEPVKEEANWYVGIEKCKGCHPNEFNDESKRNHAKAWKILEMRGEENNLECVKCHATGTGKPGGFVSSEKTPHLAGKQCEACHGPGGAHVKDASDLKLREKMKVSSKDNNICLECHLCMTTHRTINF